MAAANGFHRLVHLDLKGIPPTAKRLVQLPEIFASLGLTGMLVEWEATFPFAHFPELQAPYTYSLKTVREFLSEARKHNLLVIPLIQTFGHLESLLTREKYHYLRELPEGPRCLCPLHPDSGNVVSQMIDDVIQVHREFGLKYLHLGADEVYELGACPKCKKFVAKNGKDELFLKHMNPLFDKVNQAGVRPMIWHDMMREWPKNSVKQFVDRVDVMFWNYSPVLKQVEDFCIPENMKAYHTLGIGCWGGAAYKGADGPDKNVPDLVSRGKNTEIWYDLAKNYKLEGEALTAWTRYNTLIACCEPIESSWEALALCSLILKKGKFSLDVDAKLARRMLFGTDNPEKDGCKRNGDLWKAGEVFEELERWTRDFDWQLKRGFWVWPGLWGESRLSQIEVSGAVQQTRQLLAGFPKLVVKVQKVYKGLAINDEIEKFLRSRIEPRKLAWENVEKAIEKQLKQ